MTSDTTSSALTTYDSELASRLLHQRIIVLGTALDDTIGNRLCHQLLVLSAEDPKRDISLWINSPGGSVTAMLAIMDVIKLIPNDVNTLALGIAASAGQFLLSAGTPGKRFTLPHSRVLLHQGSAGIGGTAVDIGLQADDLKNIRDTIMSLTAQHTGQPVEQVTHDALRDRWYTAQQALDYGFVDHIVESWSDIRPESRTPIRLGDQL